VPSACDWVERSPARDLTRLAASPMCWVVAATVPMLAVTSAVPAEAWVTLRTISLVAEPCSSTAVAMAEEQSRLSGVRHERASHRHRRTEGHRLLPREQLALDRTPPHDIIRRAPSYDDSEPATRMSHLPRVNRR
jgi:hypothetical protein